MAVFGQGARLLVGAEPAVARERHLGRSDGDEGTQHAVQTPDEAQQSTLQEIKGARRGQDSDSQGKHIDGEKKCKEMSESRGHATLDNTRDGHVRTGWD